MPPPILVRSRGDYPNPIPPTSSSVNTARALRDRNRSLLLACERDAESLDVWGFKDSGFTINENGHVVLGGNRYELSGKELPRLIPWVRETLEIPFDANDVYKPSYPTKVPPPVENAQFLNEIKQTIANQQICTDDLIRLRHGHGQICQYG